MIKLIASLSFIMSLNLAMGAQTLASSDSLGLLSQENIQGGLPAHYTAKRFADLNLHIELKILKSSGGFACYVVPYFDGYKVLWIGRAGKEVPASLRREIDELILSGFYGPEITPVPTESGREKLIPPAETPAPR